MGDNDSGVMSIKISISESGTGLNMGSVGTTPIAVKISIPLNVDSTGSNHIIRLLTIEPEGNTFAARDRA